MLANLDRLAIYAGTFATLIAGRWGAAMAVAALSVRGLATGLVFLRGALIRTGIGALIVGAGELVYWFTRLVSGAGGFGEAMGLLKDVAVDVWDRIKMGAAAAGAAAAAMFYNLKADAATGMAGAIESVVAFGNTTANTFEGALLAVRAIWSRLPEVIGDLAFSAANRMLDGIEAMLNGAIRRIDAFTGKIRDALAAVGIETAFGEIGEISLGDIPNPFAGASAEAGTAAAEAFQRAFEDNPFTVPDLGLDRVATEALAAATTYRQAATDLAAGATAPLRSWDALRDAVRGAGDDGAAVLDESRNAASQLTETLAQTEGTAQRTGRALKAAGDGARQSMQAAREAMERMKEIATGLAEDITGPLKAALLSGELSWQSFAGAVAGIAGNLANRLIDQAFKPIEDALFRAFSGSGAAGSGSGLLGGLASALGSLFGLGGSFARGGAFDTAGEITAFAKGGVMGNALGGLAGGGIVSRPTLFPFARGIGLMGEAGPEAILPLRRGRGGRLGVEMNSAPAQPAPAMSTRIINVLDPSVVGDYLATASGERAILNVIRRNRSAWNA
jgi:methyl-accepting chemotaxis protein